MLFQHKDKNCALILLRWRTQSCRLTSGCCPGAQRPQKGICFRREQCTFLLGSPPPNCMWTAIAIRCCRCHQVLEKLDARRTNLSIRFIDHRACSSAKALHRLRFSSVRSITRLSRARMVPLSVWAPHTDVDPLLLQHTWKPSDSIKGWHSAAQGLFGPAVWPSRGAQRRGAPCPRIPPPVRGAFTAYTRPPCVVLFSLSRTCNSEGVMVTPQ